jgi:hypothetical protein
MKARLVAAALLAGAVVLSGPVGAATGPRLTTPTKATKEDLEPARTYADPYVLIDPDNPLVVLAATVEMRSRACRVFRSADGGGSWKLLDTTPSLPSFPYCHHTRGATTMTPMAWGRNGSLYLARTGWDTQDIGVPGFFPGTWGNMSVLLGRSTDLGDTWDTTIVRNARGKQGPETETNIPVSSVAVDTKRGSDDIVYVTWSSSRYLVRPPVNDSPMVAVSTDGGRTFGEPVVAIGGDIEAVLGGAPGSGSEQALAVADDGTVYMLWLGEVNERYMLLLSTSTDQGRTFTTTTVADPKQSSADFFLGSAFRWSPEGGKQGTLHVLYEDRTDGPWGDRDILYRRSTDGGRSFSEPRRMNDDDRSLRRIQGSPNVSVAPNGRLDAIWWDFRNDPGLFATDVYYSYSTDNGVTWSTNERVTDQLIRRKIGVWSNGYDQRQPPGVASSNELAVFVWDDTRDGDELTQTQDIFSAAAQFQAVGSSTSNAWWYVTGAAGGLALVGLILLVASLGRRDGPGRDPVVPPAETLSRPAVGTS